ncbi:MAG: hypothetical protein H7196_00965 [candidate division SR1 bacterium]|nr:hypothetical protein [candidate division SR1 bacterium]
MITAQELKTKTPTEVVELYKNGSLDNLRDARLTSDQFTWISGTIIHEMAEKGILYTEKQSSAN